MFHGKILFIDQRKVHYNIAIFFQVFPLGFDVKFQSPNGKNLKEKFFDEFFRLTYIF
jgi:hypothetical protein